MCTLFLRSATLPGGFPQSRPGQGGRGSGVVARARVLSSWEGWVPPKPLPEALPSPRDVFISLVGSNRLSIEINRENIFQTLKHALPLISALKINPGGQPAKNVNCRFRRVREELRGSLTPTQTSTSPRQRRVQLGDADAGVLRWPGHVGAWGAAGGWQPGPTSAELLGLGPTFSTPTFLAYKRIVKQLFLSFFYIFSPLSTRWYLPQGTPCPARLQGEQQSPRVEVRCRQHPACPQVPSHLSLEAVTDRTLVSLQNSHVEVWGGDRSGHLTAD